MCQDPGQRQSTEPRNAQGPKMPALTLLLPTSHLSTYLMVTYRQPHKCTLDCPWHQCQVSQGHETRFPGRKQCALQARFPIMVSHRLGLKGADLDLPAVHTGTCTAYCPCHLLSSMALTGINSNSLPLSETGPERARVLGTPESQGFSGRGACQVQTSAPSLSTKLSPPAPASIY